jgi:fucose permease
MRWGRIGVAFGIFGIIGMNLGGTGVLLPTQIEDYHIDKAVIGTVFFATSIGYFAAATGGGALLQRMGLRAYLLAGGALMFAATAAMALRPSFALYLALQLVSGLGNGALEAGLNAYLSTLDRATALLNSLHAFFGVGALIGPVVAARMLSWGYAWTAYFVVIAVLLAVCSAGLLLYPPTATHESADPGGTNGYGAALRHPAVWLGGLFLAVYVGVEISLGNWSFTFLTEDRGHGVVLAGWAVSGYWMGFTAGRFVLSRLAERFGVSVVTLIAACVAGAIACALVVWLVPGTAVPGLALLGFCLGPMYPTLIAVIPRLVPARLVATAIGLLVGVSVGGGALFPWLAGTIAQRFGAWSLFPFSVALSAVVALSWRLIATRMTPTPEPALTPSPH